MRVSVVAVVALPLFKLTSTTTCPFGQAAEAGLLSKDGVAKFEAVKREEPDSGTFSELHKKDAGVAIVQGNGKRELSLPLGGGLRNGVLQPFTGRLSLITPPKPQSHGLKAIPDAGHRYVAPGKTDRRGVCPGLNTLANHGYISHNGITTWAEAANAIQNVYGFGYDLASILSALGLMAGGDLVSGKFSIGGADSRVPNTLGPSLGLDKHGECEVDNSITRQDNYFGNQADFQMSRWQALLKTASSHNNLFNEATFIDEKKRSYDDSRATNPSFNAGPKWFVIAHDTPDYATIAPFFLNHTFPQNWYSRPTPYEFSVFNVDIGSLYAGSPTELGGNEGLNNFVSSGINPSTMSPSQLACFILENILDSVPGSFAPAILDSYDLFQGFINGAIAPFFATYNCNLTNYTVPSADAGDDTTGSPSDSGPVLINGTYQHS